MARSKPKHAPIPAAPVGAKEATQESRRLTAADDQGDELHPIPAAEASKPNSPANLHSNTAWQALWRKPADTALAILAIAAVGWFASSVIEHKTQLAAIQALLAERQSANSDKLTVLKQDIDRATATLKETSDKLAVVEQQTKANGASLQDLSERVNDATDRREAPAGAAAGAHNSRSVHNNGR